MKHSQIPQLTEKIFRLVKILCKTARTVKNGRNLEVRPILAGQMQAKLCFESSGSIEAV